ncbi:MAG: GIY-YIG nuclease family protein [Steroidobacteraceae bacterium]
MTSNSVDDPLRPLCEVTQPDARQSNLATSLEELHAGLSALVLHDTVPLGVRQLFETAKNARLYTYFVYRFHQVAEMLAYQTLERALRERWNREFGFFPTIDDSKIRFPGLSELLQMAVDRGWIRKSGFQSVVYRANNAVMQIHTHNAIVEMQKSGLDELPLQAPAEAELQEAMTRIDIPAILAAHLPDLRNSLAHGSAHLAPTSDLVLADVCDAVNMIFDGTPSIAFELKNENRSRMHRQFNAYLHELEPKRQLLLAMRPVTRDTLPKGMPLRGIYLFSEGKQHLYVGRSNSLRKRIGRHCRLSAKHNMASFAFLLVRESANLGAATYRKGQGRKELLEQEHAREAFANAKKRIRLMDVRFVEETDPIKQTLLELYVSVVHQTPYNDFDTH